MREIVILYERSNGDQMGRSVIQMISFFKKNYTSEALDERRK